MGVEIKTLSAAEWLATIPSDFDEAMRLARHLGFVVLWHGANWDTLININDRSTVLVTEKNTLKLPTRGRRGD